MERCRAGSSYSLERLSAFIDGDLPSVELQLVRQHLEECPSCAARAHELGAMARAARALDVPEPPPTLWSAIEGALERDDERPGSRGWWRSWRTLRFWRPFGLGALAGAAIVLVVLLGWRRARPSAPELARAPASKATPAVPAPTDPLLIEAEQELTRAAAVYERSIDKLRRLLVREEARWSPEVRARYDERLARLDESIARSREAARLVPGDGEGHEQLFAAYQQKIAFLAETVQRGGSFGPGAP